MKQSDLIKLFLCLSLFGCEIDKEDKGRNAPSTSSQPQSEDGTVDPGDSAGEGVNENEESPDPNIDDQTNPGPVVGEDDGTEPANDGGSPNDGTDVVTDVIVSTEKEYYGDPEYLELFNEIKANLNDCDQEAPPVLYNRAEDTCTTYPVADYECTYTNFAKAAKTAPAVEELLTTYQNDGFSIDQCGTLEDGKPIAYFLRINSTSEYEIRRISLTSEAPQG